MGAHLIIGNIYFIYRKTGVEVTVKITDDFVISDIDLTDEEIEHIHKNYIKTRHNLKKIAIKDETTKPTTA